MPSGSPHPLGTARVEQRRARPRGERLRPGVPDGDGLGLHADRHRFADPLTKGVANTEVVVFEDCAHASIYENVEAFNQRALDFLHRHCGPDVSG